MRERGVPSRSEVNGAPASRVGCLAADSGRLIGYVAEKPANAIDLPVSAIMVGAGREAI